MVALSSAMQGNQPGGLSGRAPQGMRNQDRLSSHTHWVTDRNTDIGPLLWDWFEKILLALKGSDRAMGDARPGGLSAETVG